MKKLIENLAMEAGSWEKEAERYHKMAMESDHNKIRQEGLFCTAATFSDCAGATYRILQGK